MLLSYSDIEKSEKIDTLEEDENPLDLHRFNSQKTMFLSNISASEELNIAGKEEKLPIAILNDDFCEKLDSPPHTLCPEGKFGHKIDKSMKLSPVKYFNQWLLNRTQLFASYLDYIFFRLSVTQQSKRQNQINIAMKRSLH